MTIEERAAEVDRQIQEEKLVRTRIINRVLARTHAKTHVPDCWCRVTVTMSPVSMRMVALIFEHPRYRMFGEINYT